MWPVATDVTHFVVCLPVFSIYLNDVKMNTDKIPDFHQSGFSDLVLINQTVWSNTGLPATLSNPEV